MSEACASCGGTGIEPAPAEIVKAGEHGDQIDRWQRQSHYRPGVYKSIEMILASHLSERLECAGDPLDSVKLLTGLIRSAQVECLASIGHPDRLKGGRLTTFLDNLTDAAAEIVFLLAAHGYPTRESTKDRLRAEARALAVSPKPPAPRSPWGYIDWRRDT